MIQSLQHKVIALLQVNLCECGCMHVVAWHAIAVLLQLLLAKPQSCCRTPVTLPKQSVCWCASVQSVCWCAGEASEAHASAAMQLHADQHDCESHKRLLLKA